MNEGEMNEEEMEEGKSIVEDAAVRQQRVVHYTRTWIA